MTSVVNDHHYLRSGTLLAAFVLTAIAGAVAHVLPLANEIVPIAILLDIVPFVSAAAATIVIAVSLRNLSLPPTRLLIAAYGYFAGALVAMLGLAHLVAIIIGAIGRGTQHQFVYNFHFYSLVLLGILLIATGLMAAMQAERLGRGHRAAWCGSLWVWIAILVINLPLVPLQGFAVLFSVLATLEILFLIGTRSHVHTRPMDNSGSAECPAGQFPGNAA